MSTDYAEEYDLAATYPDILAEVTANFTVWYVVAVVCSRCMVEGPGTRVCDG